MASHEAVILCAPVSTFLHFLLAFPWWLGLWFDAMVPLLSTAVCNDAFTTFPSLFQPPYLWVTCLRGFQIWGDNHACYTFSPLFCAFLRTWRGLKIYTLHILECVCIWIQMRKSKFMIINVFIFIVRVVEFVVYINLFNKVVCKIHWTSKALYISI